MVLGDVRTTQGPGFCIQQLELNGVRVAQLHAHENDLDAPSCSAIVADDSGPSVPESPEPHHLIPGRFRSIGGALHIV
jgi:hypothetical protein